MAFSGRARQAIITVVKGGITIAVIASIVHALGWDAITDALERADFRWLLLALAVFTASAVLGVVQWRLLLHNKNITLSFSRAFSLYFIGMFFNNFMFGMIAGDAVKVTLMKSHNVRFTAGFAATFLDRFVGLWAMMGFALMGSAMLLGRGLLGNRSIVTAALALSASFLLFCLICVFLVSRRIQRRIFALLDYLPLPGKQGILTIAGQVVLEAHNRLVIVPVALLSIVIQFMRIAVHILAAASLGLLTFENLQYFFIFVPIIGMLMMIPLPFGIKEAVEGSLFYLAGFGPDSPHEPMVMGFLASLIGVAASLAGGVLFLTRRTGAVEVWRMLRTGRGEEAA